MAIPDEKKVDIETEHTESVEPELGVVSKIEDDVLSIEEVAASKAAWLISVTVSLGGYVYNRQWLRDIELTASDSSSVMTQAISHRCLSRSAPAWDMCYPRASKNWLLL
jgi:hypothetical protein